ncbi:hypothetical protein NPIL_291021 [Nephila pilipes]|uniref:Uncharacterized protein n=1 Tax=Nephila pilipes TaxID=299642 RepID=A0A8X6MTY5_NEPPI|nr:hypothetical protein NPIL_291021 [Nephila pilipes]
MFLQEGWADRVGGRVGHTLLSSQAAFLRWAVKLNYAFHPFANKSLCLLPVQGIDTSGNRGRENIDLTMILNGAF